MLDIILYGFLVVFSLAVGWALGTGNYAGFKGAIITGIIAGLLAAIPMLRDAQYAVSAVMVVLATIGSVISLYTPDTNGLKRWVRTHPNIGISVGKYYRLGKRK